MRTLSAAIIAIAFSVVACGGGDDTTSSTPTSSPSTTASPTVSPTVTPAVTVTLGPTATPAPLPPLSDVDSAVRLIYNTGPYAYEGMEGPLWISDITGTHTLALTPDGVSATFAGMTGDPLGGAGSIYYITNPDDDTSSIYRGDFPGGAPEHVLDFVPFDGRFASAEVSPDGHYVAFADKYGLELLNLDTYGVRRLADDTMPVSCFTGGQLCSAVFSSPVWSPDGKLIAMRETFYEGGDYLVLDPFSAKPQPVVAANWSIGGWSADSQSICSSSEEETVGLQISQAPGWARQAYLASYVDPNTSENASEVSCSWLDGDTLAISLNSSGNYPRPDYSFVATVDIPGGVVTRLAPNQDGQCCPQVFAVPDAGLVLSQYILQNSDSTVAIPSQPEAIDVATGQAYSLLQQGDWIVAVVTP